ncbi:MAG TPA: PEP/pyruvate-binding domain-containing protein [Ktedonobacteraceae bacterium]|nr:PEP/pyruvate-binding domain-containing protein [Ktedonobacteraceae bacterium]
MSIQNAIPLILPLDDDAATLEQVGGKGASLARLSVNGLPVPAGFHITTSAYRSFVAINALQEKILAAVSTASADQPATLDEAASKIAVLFAQSPVPEEIARAIRQAYAQLDGGEQSVAVRSSATAEDLPEMSFAGQQETYLNMRGEAMVLDAVKRCWASLWTARAIGYRARNHIAPAEVSLAVVVQELVPADAAGILFTANPISGAREQVMINAAWGLGEAIVGGLVTPDTFVIERANWTMSTQQISEKDVMTVRTPEGTHEEPVPADKRKQAVLNLAQATELARIGVKIEEIYGQPMDIEWALHDGHFFIVQARPITALPDVQNASKGSQIVEWKLLKPKGKYTRNSVIELLPDPLTPLYETLGLPAVARATKKVMADVGIANVFSDDTLITINDYAYYDVGFTPAETTRLMLSLPRVFILFPGLLHTSKQRWEAARAQYAALARRWQTTDLTSSSATELLNGVLAIAEEAGGYYLSIQSGILPAAYISEMIFTQVYNRLLKERKNASAPTALTFMLGFDSTPMQAEKSLYDLSGWVNEQEGLASVLKDLSGEQFVTAYHQRTSLVGASSEAWQMFWQRIDEHLQRFGHTIYDLDFAKGVLAEDPAPLLETLKFFLSGQAPDPYKRQANAEAARNEATRQVTSRLRGYRLRTFRRQLERAQRYAPLREDALADVGLGWPVLRQMLHEIGLRLVNHNAIETADEVYWLRLHELREAVNVLDAGQAPADYQGVIAERHVNWERMRKLTPPAALPIKGGARFLGIDFSNLMPARLDQPEGDVLKGIAASPGIVTGPACVIYGPEEFERMRPGDILVARITTPAWTPLFALASGVVTDVGGPLSHGSIVAREYHIPAVLGTGVATERLSSGQQITVDGNAGTVTLAK